jgi:hypothetical protein
MIAAVKKFEFNKVRVSLNLRAAVAMLVVAFAFLFEMTINVTPVGGSGLPAATAAFLFWLSAGSLLICMSGGSGAGTRNMLIVFAAAYTVRFIAAMVLFPIFTENRIYPDHWTYLNTATIIAERWAENPIAVYKSMGGYWQIGIYMFAAGVLKISGQPLVIAATSTFFSAYCGVLAYRIGARLIHDPRKDGILFIGALLFALFPLSIYWGSPLLKEPLVAFFCLLCIDKLYGFLEGKLLVPSLYMALCIAMVAMFRFYMAPVIAATVLVSMLIYSRRSHKVKLFSILIVAACIGLAVACRPALTNSPIFRVVSLRSEHVLTAGIYSVISETRETVAGKGQTDVQQLQYNSPADIPKLMPLAIFRGFTTPVRWFLETDQPMNKIVVACTAVWYLLMPFTIAGFFRWLARGGLKETPVVVFLVLSIIVNSLLFLGGSMRHNVPMFPFWCLFAAIGLSRWRENILFAFMMYLALGAILAFVEFTMIPAAAVLAPSILAVIAGLLYALWAADKNGRGTSLGERRRIS